MWMLSRARIGCQGDRMLPSYVTVYGINADIMTSHIETGAYYGQ